MLDRTSRRVLLVGSAQGGVDIEELAASDPGAITKIAAHPHLGLQDHLARRMAFALDLGAHLRDAVAVCKGLVSLLYASDADLVEVNPLAIVREAGADGPAERLALLDAKITIDDSARSMWWESRL